MTATFTEEMAAAWGRIRERATQRESDEELKQRCKERLAGIGQTVGMGRPDYCPTCDGPCVAVPRWGVTAEDAVRRAVREALTAAIEAPTASGAKPALQTQRKRLMRMAKDAGIDLDAEDREELER